MTEPTDVPFGFDFEIPILEIEDIKFTCLQRQFVQCVNDISKSLRRFIGRFEHLLKEVENIQR